MKTILRSGDTLYLSGPMSGHVDSNFPAFREAADTLKLAGYRVINPADFEHKPGEAWEDWIARDIAVIASSRPAALAMLPLWEQSPGAAIEIQTAQWLGIPLVDAGDLSAIPYPFPWSRPTCSVEYRRRASVHVVEKGPAFDPRIDPRIDPRPDAVAARRAVEWPTANPTPAKPKSNLAQADELINGDRQASYGHPFHDYTTNGAVWAANLTHYYQRAHPGILNGPLPAIPAEVACLMMDTVKVTRAIKAVADGKPMGDSAIDGPGYWGCAQKSEDFRRARVADAKRAA